MVCPNCHSTDIITVQNENFCISCGHVVPKSAQTKRAPTIEELTKVQAKVAQSDEMAVLKGEKPKLAPAEPLAPKVRGLGPKLRTGAKVAADVTVNITPGADKKAAAEAQAELAQAVASALAPAAKKPDPKAASAPPPATKATPKIIEATVKPEPTSSESPAEPKPNPTFGKSLISKFAPGPATPAAPAASVAPASTPESKAAPGPESQTTSTTSPVRTAKAKITATVSKAAGKRRKPGRPKAGRLDVPASVTATLASAPTNSSPAPSASASTPIAPTPTPLPSRTQIKPPVAVSSLPAAPRVHESSALRPFTDIRPAVIENAPTPPAATKPTPVQPSTAPAPSAPDSLTAISTSDGIDQPLLVDEPVKGFGGVITTSLHERVRPVSFAWSLIPATFLALLAGGVAMALLRGHLHSAVAATQHAGWAVWGEALLVLGLYYLSHSLVNAAIVFGIARRTAHRPVPAARQYGAAVNTWLSRVSLDLLTILLQLLVVGLIGGFMVLGSIVWPVPEYLQLGGLFAVYLVAMYALAGLTLTQGLGRVALTVSPMAVTAALRLGWSLFWRHFELTGFRTLALLLEVLIMVPFGAGVLALLLFTPASLHWAAVVLIIVLTIAAGALVGAGTAAWWEAAYRHIIERDYNNESGKLLGGRPAERPQPLPLTTLILAATVLTGLSIAWPWIM